MADYFCRVVGTFPNGRKWSTGRHITSTRSAAAMATVWANAWQSAWTDATFGLEANYPTNTTIDFADVATLNASMEQVARTAPVAIALPGTNATATLPTNVAVVVSWRNTTAIGREKRGHQSLPAPSEDQVVWDKLTTASRTRFTGAMNIIKTAVTADGSTFFIFPRFLTFRGTPPFTKSVIDVVETRDKVGTQDKRPKKEGATYG